MAFGNRITTTTQDKIVPKLVDNILNSNVFATRMLMAAKEWHGETLKFPAKFSKNSTGTSFAGFDTFSTSATDNRKNIQFTPSFYQITSALPGDEYSVNKNNEEKVLDLVKLTLASDSQDAADDIGTMFFADGTGNGSKDTLGLAAIVDDGTSTSTYGGLTRSSNTWINSTVTASGGTLSLAKMRTLYNAAKRGNQRPTLGITDEATFGFYESLLQPQERLHKEVGTVKGLKNGTGYDSLFFAGMPILADEKCTTGVLFFLNEDFLEWYALPFSLPGAAYSPVKYRGEIDGNDYSEVEGLGFSWSGWIVPANAGAVVGHTYLGGQLVSANPRMHAKLTGITGV